MIPEVGIPLSKEDDNSSSSPGIIHAGETDSSDSFFRFNIQIALSARLGGGEGESGGCGIKDIVSPAAVNISATKEEGGGTTA